MGVSRLPGCIFLQAGHLYFTMGWVCDKAMKMKQGEHDEREARRFMGYEAPLPDASPKR
jgi:hypothetical protein